ncbi:MAG TPA: LppX_LprAFG lipoprotein [Nocardioides sp.]|nr:LppX_LprAFG lipoprotein [Nocardioides sp.]
MKRALLPLTASALLLAGCGSSGGSTTVSPDQAMATAKQKLDATSGVEVSLKASADPGVDYLQAADGTIVANPPAFQGTVAGRVSGLSDSGVDVISVGGKLWINVPILGWTDQYSAKSLCAPDPANLLDPNSGVSDLLTSATDLTAGKSERDTTDASIVITPYSGKESADAIKKVLPCANGDSFDATFDIASDGSLRSAALTGSFFPGASPITYTIDITKYDVTKDIKAPK